MAADKPFYFDYERDASVPFRMIELVMNRDLTGMDQGLYVAICFLSRKKGYCFASNKRLAKGMKKTVRYVQKCLANLVAYNFVKVEVKEGRRRLFPADHQRQSPHERPGHLNKKTDELLVHPPMNGQDIHKYSEDTNVSSSLKEKVSGGKPTPHQVFHKTPENGLVELNGEVSSSKEKKTLPEPSKKAKEAATKLRQVINSIPGWRAGSGSHKNWARAMDKLAKDKSPREDREHVAGWKEVDRTLTMLEKYAREPEYLDPVISNAEQFRNKFAWINQTLKKVRERCLQEMR